MRGWNALGRDMGCEKEKPEGIAARLEFALEARQSGRLPRLPPGRPNPTGIRPAAPDAWGRGARGARDTGFLLGNFRLLGYIRCMISVDEPITLGGPRGEVTTLRQLASDGRVVLRRSAPYRIEDSDEALWAEVRHQNDPDATERLEINTETYAEMISLGVPRSS